MSTFWCHPPQLAFAGYEPRPAGCDPTVGPCTVRANVGGTFPGSSGNSTSIGFSDSPTKLTWALGESVVGSCGSFAGRIQDDRGRVWIQAGNFSCANPEAATGTGVYRLTALQCDGGCPVTRTLDVDLTAQAIAAEICPPPPVDYSCNAPSSCETCLAPGGAAGGASVGGGGPSTGGPGTGPKALLYYRAGGVGHPGSPGAADHNVALGRHWIHSYAQRLVEEPGGVAWLLTRFGAFARFVDGNADGLYDAASPGDEYRTLEKQPDGTFELRDLDGTVERFDAAGLWTETEDRNGNARVATYVAGQLSQVQFPDGRREDFAYHPDGKLAAITEVGVDGTTTRTWSYTWTGNDLTRIDRPDGTALAYRYDDVAHPGFLTRVTLAGSDASERITAAFAYDAAGNVVTMWRGTAGPSDPGVVDKWELSFDDPALPEETTVTDPLGGVSTYTLATRGSRSEKPRLTALSGSCPTCGLGPNSQLTYGDPANPYRPTQEIDGNGNVTVMSYDLNGQMFSRIEAFGTALERETTWEYDPIFPAFATERVQPSVTGNPFDERRTSTIYDAEGNATSRTIAGFEGVSTFSLTTTTIYNGAGQPTAIDPPGFATADETSFTYDPSRGDLVALTRTDPVIGTTSFGHDAFNRQTSVTDPNGVVSVTAYDDLNRVTQVTHVGAVPAEDLVTQYEYTVFGDLFRITLPRGNVIEYGYDTAGRLMSIERKPDASTPGERTLYALAAFGHRTREELQRWDGLAWVTESSTDYLYSTRCHLDQVVHAGGKVTEYDYDCDGNLSREWDANHPSAGKTSPATRVYTYDVLDRLTAVVEPWGGAGGGNAVTSYGYDVQDHLVSVTDAEGNTTAYTFSDRDLMTEEDSPVSGVTTHAYDEHGSLASTTDARSVTVLRTYDAADRVTFVDYPDPALDTTYAYGDAGVPFSQGRLTAITRDGASVDYAYDRFGRVTQDGALLYGYDENGNRVSIEYPGEVTATYSFDFADRESSLTVDDGSGPQAVVTSASYLPSGPLTALTLGNGVTESRLFDGRYFPDSIAVATTRNHSWNYTTDDVGNITSIVETEDCVLALALADRTLIGQQTFVSCDDLSADPNVTVAAGAEVTFRAGNTISLGAGFAVATGATFSAVTGSSSPKASSFTYGYQDFQYFLAAADGPPWGSLAWTYDRIGNRLTENRNGSVDSYSYVSNGSGNTAILTQAGSRTYTTGPAGHVTSISDGVDPVDLPIDDAGRVAGFEQPLATAETAFEYDGRSFLRRSEELLGGGPDVGFTEPTYSSEGVLLALHRQLSPSDPEEHVSVFYFAGRAIAQLRQEIGGPSSWLFLSTDHLGTTVLATDVSAVEVWHGPFEPFGSDFFRNSTESALGERIFLRFPGQWQDSTWSEYIPSGMYYNVHRWYQAGSGRYATIDPLGLVSGVNSYLYAGANPSINVDDLGLINFRGFWRCVIGIASVANSRFADDAKKHCWSSCKISCECGLGTIGSAFVGVGKEIQDLFGPGRAEFRDLLNNAKGNICASSGAKQCCNQTGSCCAPTISACECDRCCDCLSVSGNLS